MGASLAARAVALTRGPDRAGPMIAALQSAGARPLLFPLIDFEIPADMAALDAAVARLTRGGFDWLVVTSVTTVRALAGRGAAAGLTLGQLVPDSTRVAAVGARTREGLEAEGITVELVPAREQSGQGLLTAWRAGSEPSPVSVLLPQANIADPALKDGLLNLGADVVAVTAYRTVNYPADPERRLARPAARPAAAAAAAVEQPGTAPVLTPAEFSFRQRQGTIDAVVLTSPSAARRLREECPRLHPLAKVVAIGRPTAAEAARCGFEVAAVAPDPTPEGIVAALEHAFESAADSAVESPPPSTKEYP